MICALLCPLKGQEDSVMVGFIDTVIIQAGRISTPYLAVPASLSRVDLSEKIQFTNHTDLGEALSVVPGLFTLNGQNFAQDLRISLRGFGARAAFGIRGIKLIVDGIPETTPDGQGQLDNISVSDISGIEVLQGTSGAQYGNASGGVIEITTLEFNPETTASANIRLGSYGLREYQLRTNNQIGKTKILISGNHLRSSGYRVHSGLIQTNVLSRMVHQWSDSKMVFQASYLNSPKAQDPGGINLSEAIEMPQSARSQNVSFNAGEEIVHWKTSIRYETKLNPDLQWVTGVFYSGRDFDGRLPFTVGGAIDLNRKYGGVMSQVFLQHVGDDALNKLSFGIDVLSQRDNRNRFENFGTSRGDMDLSQLEKFDNFGIYLIDQWSNQKWTIKGSLRYDDNNIGIEDFMLADGDDSGVRNLSDLNYSIGINYRIFESHSTFMSWSTSFETPTLSELSANPTGGGGFNNDLNAMRAKTLELGSRGVFSNQLSYSFSIYQIKSKDELIPYELNAFPGRNFFRNAGSTKRHGIETSVRYDGLKNLELSNTYTYSNFKFDEYTVDGNNLKDKLLPGIPQHAINTEVVYRDDNWYVKLASQYFSRISARDDGEVEVKPYHIVHLRIGSKHEIRKVNLHPFLAVNNLFSANYFDNLRLNAFGGRYYEPAATINWQIGCSVDW